MKTDSVIAEIHRLIDEKIASGATVYVDWIAQEIMQRKGEIDGENADFYRVCTFQQIAQMAKRAIGKYQPSHSTPAQLVMDGFKYLAKAYPMTRGGDLMLIPVDQCSDDELRARANELDRMAISSRAHAGEIRQYVSSRVGAHAA